VNDRVVNRFVKILIDVMDKAASDVHEMNVRLGKPRMIPTPYGGKLIWVLPGQNLVIAHLKDKTVIRHIKRWSQVSCYSMRKY
jgi:chitin synthase